MRFSIYSSLLLSMVFFAGLSGCFHNLEEETDEPQIFTPNLSSEGSYDELLAKPQVVISDTAALKAVVSKVYPRLLSHLTILNLHVDLLPSSGIDTTVATPSFKLTKPTYHLQPGARACDMTLADDINENVDARDLQNRRANFWFDADGDDVFSPGDDWIRLLSQCRDPATNVLSTGTVTFHDMSDQKVLLDGTDEFADIDRLQVEVRMQSDYNEGSSLRTILFNKVFAEYSRDDVAGSRFAVNAGSVSAASNGSAQYAFVFDQAVVSYIETGFGEDLETVSFSGKYYDSELGGYIVIQDLSLGVTTAYGIQDINSISMKVNPQTDAAVLATSVVPGSAKLAIGQGDAEDVPFYGDLSLFGYNYLKIVPMD